MVCGPWFHCLTNMMGFIFNVHVSNMNLIVSEILSRSEIFGIYWRREAYIWCLLHDNSCACSSYHRNSHGNGYLTYLCLGKNSFGVHTDKSPKICTHVEQIFLYKVRLLLNIDVAVPFFKVKILPKTVFPFSVHLIARVCRYRRPIRCPHLFWLTANNIPLELLGASG